MIIIEQARELLELAECAEGSDGAAWAAGNALERRAPGAIAALCRALIARDEALAELVACKDLKERAEDLIESFGGTCRTLAESAAYYEVRNDYLRRKPRAWAAARRALTDVLPRADDMDNKQDDVNSEEKNISRASDNTVSQSTFCCERFAHEADHLQAMAGGGFMYPPGMRPSAQFERGDDGSWNINGCCGGGCHVVSDMRFCPFCGSNLSP